MITPCPDSSTGIVGVNHTVICNHLPNMITPCAGDFLKLWENEQSQMAHATQFLQAGQVYNHWGRVNDDITLDKKTVEDMLAFRTSFYEPQTPSAPQAPQASQAPQVSQAPQAARTSSLNTERPAAASHPARPPTPPNPSASATVLNRNGAAAATGTPTGDRTGRTSAGPPAQVVRPAPALGDAGDVANAAAVQGHRLRASERALASDDAPHTHAAVQGHRLRASERALAGDDASHAASQGHRLRASESALGGDDAPMIADPRGDAAAAEEDSDDEAQRERDRWQRGGLYDEGGAPYGSAAGVLPGYDGTHAIGAGTSGARAQTTAAYLDALTDWHGDSTREMRVAERDYNRSVLADAATGRLGWAGEDATDGAATGSTAKKRPAKDSRAVIAKRLKALEKSNR